MPACYQFSLRLPARLHETAREMAAYYGISMNQFVSYALVYYIDYMRETARQDPERRFREGADGPGF